MAVMHGGWNPTVYFACGVKKHRFFLRCFGPSAARDFILAMLQDLGFYVDLGSRRGPGRKNWHLKIGST